MARCDVHAIVKTALPAPAHDGRATSTALSAGGGLIREVETVVMPEGQAS
jgi:hypothetical protein